MPPPDASPSLLRGTTSFASAAAGGGSAASPPARAHGADGELGFLYEQDRGWIRAELGVEKAELLRARTDAASARFARNILRSVVARYVEKRRAVHAELRHMEGERATLDVQLSLLRQKAGDAEAELRAWAGEGAADKGGGGGDSEGAATEGGLLRLLDEAEERHAAVLAQRRRDHMGVVGSLQREYLHALKAMSDAGGDTGTFAAAGAKGTGSILSKGAAPLDAAAAANGADGVPPPSSFVAPTGGGGEEEEEEAAATATAATAGGGGDAPRRQARFGDVTTATHGSAALAGALGAPPSGPLSSLLSGYTTAEVVASREQIQRELFHLEGQIQRLKDALLGKERALAAAESVGLQMRGAVVAAEEAKAAAEGRIAAAEAAAEMAASQLEDAKGVVAHLRARDADYDAREAEWAEERRGLTAQLDAAEARRIGEARALIAEHDAAMRSLEERLAFETASREYDRKEVVQLTAALKAVGGLGAAADPIAAQQQQQSQQQQQQQSQPPPPPTTTTTTATTPSAGGRATGGARRSSKAHETAAAVGPAASTAGAGGASLAPPGSGFGKKAVQRAGVTSGSAASGGGGGGGAAAANRPGTPVGSSRGSSRGPAAKAGGGKRAPGAGVRRKSAAASPLGR